MNIPDTFDESVHSTHRRCYQGFTNVYFVSRKKSAESAKCLDVDEPQTSTFKIRRSSVQAASKAPFLHPISAFLVIRTELKFNKYATFS